MCEYCKEEYPKEFLTEANTYASGADGYIGIDTYIEENKLIIEAVGEVGYPSRDTTYVEAYKKINYCPICGKKLGEEQ